MRLDVPSSLTVSRLRSSRARPPTTTDARGRRCPPRLGDRANLGGLEKPRLPGLQVAELDLADPDAHEAGDRSLNCAEHPSQLALPALAERREVPGQAGIRGWVEGRRDPADLAGRCASKLAGETGEAFLQPDAGIERPRLIAGQGRADRDRVLALDPEPGVEHALRPVA